MTGSRNDSGATRGPNCTRLVWSARYASETMHSSESSSGGSGMVKWSERYNPEKPLASAIATQRLQRGHVNPVWPSTEIDTSIITVPPRRAVIVDCSEVSKYILPNPRCDH